MTISFSLNVRSFCFASIALGMMLVPLISHAQDRTASRIIGKWTLVSVYEEDAGGDDLDRWGTAPKGQFIARADGSFSFLMVSRDVIRLAGNNAERACAGLRACRETMDRKVIGYAGTYSIDNKSKLLLDIADSLERGWKGTKIRTEARMEADQMHFVTASDQSPTGSFYVHLVWRKAR